MKANYNNIEKETEKAIFVVFACGRQGWLPKSIITIDSESKSIELPDWKARDLKIDEASIARDARRVEAMKKEIAKMEAEMTEAQKEEEARVSAHNAMFSHYDARRREYYAIDSKTGKRCF